MTQRRHKLQGLLILLCILASVLIPTEAPASAGTTIVTSEEKPTQTLGVDLFVSVAELFMQFITMELNAKDKIYVEKSTDRGVRGPTRHASAPTNMSQY